MDSASCIEQKGVIEEISKGMVKVSFMSVSACAECHARKACNLIDSENKHVLIPAEENTYSVGEIVRISMKRNLGLKAAVIAYVVPVFLLILTLLILTSLSMDELTAGLFTLLILAPYFILVYLFRDKMQKTFVFRLNKEN
jgi:sigma-E factor negative regulatory protein RseC